MTQQSLLPKEVQDILESAQEDAVRAEITEPLPVTYTFEGGLLDLDGEFVKDFTVRELNGRDEEALSRVNKPGMFILELLQRGLVSVGSHPGPDVLDQLTSGDWESALIAIRSVTFGKDVDFPIQCWSCRDDYEVTVDLMKDLPTVAVESPQDLSFTVEGRNGTQYVVALPTGATQRALLKTLGEQTAAEQNTVLLTDCVKSIDNKPVVVKDTVLDIPMSDRRMLLDEIGKRKPGPRLEGVTTLCPSCGAENTLSLSIAALFR